MQAEAEAAGKLEAAGKMEAEAAAAAAAPVYESLTDGEILVNIEGEGKLGIVFEVAICIQTDEFCIEIDEFCIENDDFNANVQRNSTPPQILRVSPGGLAGGHPALTGGVLLHSVQGQSIVGLSYTEVLDLIKAAGRPLRLTFVEAPAVAVADESSDDEDAEALRQMNAMVAQAPAAAPDGATAPAAARRGGATAGSEEEEQEEEGEDDEEMDDDLREEYIMGIMSNCQSCLDPISGERMLVADLSYV